MRRHDIGSRAVRWVEHEMLNVISSRPRAASDPPVA